ncbi:MAG: Argininosuccinate synthase [Candidatus Dependentiae bacterium ADurb.Bin246]|nr:MAG: Argininosuccinate synthase [Candidatus Dependentiae bacterium ADurb.Bin246]
MSKKDIKKVVLAYSGGLDTSIILKWLQDEYDAEVITFTADLGQGEEVEPARAKAIACGIKPENVYILDVKEEFVKDYVFPMFRANAIYEGEYLLGTSIARPLIAKKLVEIANEKGAQAVSHGATGKGNDQVRFELTYMALAPEIKIIAPWKDDKWTLTSREAAIDYANERKIPLEQTKAKIYSRDRNLWHISHEGGNLESPWNAPNDDIFVLSKTVEEAPDKATYVEIGFEKGEPVSVDGKKMSAVELMETLNRVGGENAIGQIDMVENRLVGMKSRGVYETPGGTILYFAHKELERLCLDRETMHYKEIVAKKYADLVYNGQWFTKVREALDAFVNVTQETVTGTVRVKLYKGNVILAGSKSDYSLYSEELSSFTDSDMYNQKDANGFIRLFGLPMKMDAYLKKSLEQKKK